jgi:uncharacterized membrane protein
MAKTLSFAVVHFSVAFALGYALVEPLCDTLAFHFHEKVWKRFESHARQHPGGMAA